MRAHPAGCTCSPLTPHAAPRPGPFCLHAHAARSYDDHRMAMAFSLVACGGVPVVIKDPGCTRKTFPTYFKVLETVTKH
jgi:3-phosphoshikimate 1-carboxyvinyltransferase